MKVVLPLLVILPLALGQAPVAFAGSQSLLDPYASIEAPTKSKTKGHKTDAVEESILDEASSSEPTSTKSSHHAEKAAKPPKEPKAAKVAKQPKATKEAKAAKPSKETASSTGGGGIMTSVKSMEERSSEGIKSAGTKLVDGTKAAGSKVAEGTKTLGERMAAGAKSSGEYLKKGAQAMGHGLQETTSKMKETASSLEHKVKPSSQPKAISAKPTSTKTDSKSAPVPAATINGVPTTPTEIKSKDGYPGKALEPVSEKPVKSHSGLLTNSFSKLNPFAHKTTTPSIAKARPIDQSKAASLDFTPAAPATPTEPSFGAQ